MAGVSLGEILWFLMMLAILAWGFDYIKSAMK